MRPEILAAATCTIAALLLYVRWQLATRNVKQSSAAAEQDLLDPVSGWYTERAFRAAVPDTVRWAQEQQVPVAVVMCSFDPQRADTAGFVDALSARMRNYERGYSLAAGERLLVLWNADDRAVDGAVGRLFGSAAEAAARGLSIGVLLTGTDSAVWSADALLHAARVAASRSADRHDLHMVVAA